MVSYKTYNNIHNPFLSQVACVGTAGVDKKTQNENWHFGEAHNQSMRYGDISRSDAWFILVYTAPFFCLLLKFPFMDSIFSHFFLA